MAQLLELTPRGLFGPPDQDIVKPILPEAGQFKPSNFPQTSFGVIAGHGIADLLRAGKPNANALSFARAAFAHLKHKTAAGYTFRPRCFQKVSPFLQHAHMEKSRLRAIPGGFFT
jgi:hypothetical protein